MQPCGGLLLKTLYALCSPVSFHQEINTTRGIKREYMRVNLTENTKSFIVGEHIARADENYIQSNKGFCIYSIAPILQLQRKMWYNMFCAGLISSFVLFQGYFMRSDKVYEKYFLKRPTSCV